MFRLSTLIVCCLVFALGVQAEELRLTFPGAAWERVKPETVGYSSAKLEVLRAWLKTQNTKAMQVSIAGRVLFEYGDQSYVSKVASVRKSILAMMYGKYVSEGKVDLNQKVEELGLNDVQPFLPIEKSATLLYLLRARSGIYHLSGNAELSALAPRRGAHLPGLYFQYTNWDFNAAGTAFEKLTGKGIFEAIETDLAQPIGMQDYKVSLQKKVSSLPDSVHPEYATYLSTRDMARLGLLMLSHGEWNGKQVIPKGWTDRITTLATPHQEIHPESLAARTQIGLWGYGMLWWVWDAPNVAGVVTGPYQGAYSANGAFGQYITVLPVMNLVITHKVDFEAKENPSLSPSEYHTILQMVMESTCEDPCK